MKSVQDVNNGNENIRKEWRRKNETASYGIDKFLSLYGDGDGVEPFEFMNDPTLTGFKLFFHFAADSGLIADENHQNSALAYLKRIGENSRYKLLEKFRENLQKININCPWIFQEINGLKEVYEMERSQVLKEKELNIETLETIDGKIGSLVKMYRDCTFDEKRNVWVIPENLRKFSMSVFVYDYRYFKGSETTTPNTADKFLQTIENTDVKKLNHTLFDLGDCTFDEKSGGTFFENVSNNLTDFSKNNITINFEDIVISSLFRTITGDVNLSSDNFDLAKKSTSTSSSIGENEYGKNTNKDIEERLRSVYKNTQISKIYKDRRSELDMLLDKQNRENTMGNIAEEAALRVEDRVEAELTQLYFGNVHGFGINDLAKLNEENSYKSAFTRIYSDVGGNKSLNNGNPYDNDL